MGVRDFDTEIRDGVDQVAGQGLQSDCYCEIEKHCLHRLSRIKAANSRGTRCACSLQAERFVIQSSGLKHQQSRGVNVGKHNGPIVDSS